MIEERCRAREGNRDQRMGEYMIRRQSLMFSMFLLGVYMLFSGTRLKSASENNHFAYLAEAFIAGQLSLKSPPPHGNDWASYEILQLREASRIKVSSKLNRPVSELKGIYLPKRSKESRKTRRFETLQGERLVVSSSDIKSRRRHYFVSFPPLPAVLMLPFVAIFGLTSSDVWLTIIFAALNGGFAYHLFSEVIRRRRRRTGSTQREHDRYAAIQDRSEALWLSISLTLGTAHFWCAVRGEVWFTALIIGVSCQLLFFKWAWDLKRPLLAGLAYACAFSTRASLITLGLFAYAHLFSKERKLQDRLRRLILFSLPPLLIGSLLLYYNHLRFERWYEFGHRYLAGGQLGRISEYGLFNTVFLKKNIIAAFALLPFFSMSAPLITYSWHGMALQFSSPHLLFILFRVKKETEEENDEKGCSNRVQIWGLAAVILSTLSLLLMYQNTGWVQYSWRFALDVIPAMTLIIALTAQARGKAFRATVLWGVLINMIGALVFGRTSLWWAALNLPQLGPH